MKTAKAKKRPAKKAKRPAKPSAPKVPPTRGPAPRRIPNYDAYRESQAEISRARSADGRDIGGIPPVVDPDRKGACRDSLQLFCETYLTETFPLAWSDDHLKVIARMEEVILRGGLFALAMPRGSGKTS